MPSALAVTVSLSASIGEANGGAFAPEGPVAREMAWLWWWMFWLGTFAFVVFAVALGIALWRRRGRADHEGENGEHDDDKTTSPRTLRRLVIGGGVVLPGILLPLTMGLTVHSMSDIPDDAGDDALVVEITGHQWWYEIHYPAEGVTTANELHLPVGEPVVLCLTSADVIHSVWIPQLGGKRDMLPDGINTLVLQADEPGEHLTICAEFCGLLHAKMRMLVIAEPREAFDTWIIANATDAATTDGELAQRGRQLFADAGCASCHTVRGTDAAGTAGPDLTHVGSRRTLAATVPFTRMHLREWVADPDAFKDGVKMPGVDLDDDDLDALLTYLEGLR